MGFLKAIHLLSLIIWLGGLLPLTWVAAYIRKEEEWMQKQTIQMCRRFYLLIDLPAMLLALATGTTLFFVKKISIAQGWLHMKLTSVFCLVLIDLTVGILLAKSKKKKIRAGFGLLHLGSLAFLTMILVSVYVLKNK